MAGRQCTGTRKSLVVREVLDRGKVEAADWGGAENKGEWRRPNANDGTSLLEFRVGQLYISQEDYVRAISSLQSKSDGRE